MKYLLLLAAVVFLFPNNAISEPLFRVSTQDGIVVTLHKEKCEMGEVANLPRSATWEEKGKTFTGCWGMSSLGVVMLYFSDKTVAVIPASAFEKVIGV